MSSHISASSVRIGGAIMTANDSKINLPSGSMVDGLTISTSDVDSGVAINRIAIGANASATVDNTAVIGDSSVAQVFAGNGNVLAGVVTGAAIPTITPVYVGQMFIDTTNTKVYIATGTAGSSDWSVLF